MFEEGLHPRPRCMRRALLSRHRVESGCLGGEERARLGRGKAWGEGRERRTPSPSRPMPTSKKAQGKKRSASLVPSLAHITKTLFVAPRRADCRGLNLGEHSSFSSSIQSRKSIDGSIDLPSTDRLIRQSEACRRLRHCSCIPPFRRISFALLSTTVFHRSPHTIQQKRAPFRYCYRGMFLLV